LSAVKLIITFPGQFHLDFGVGWYISLLIVGMYCIYAECCIYTECWKNEQIHEKKPQHLDKI